MRSHLIRPPVRLGRRTTTKLKAAACGLALVAGVSMPAALATAAPTATTVAGAPTALGTPQAVQAANAAAAAKKVPAGAYSTQGLRTLNIQFQYQQTGYWCGPAATRIALSARISPPSQQQLANELPTTTNGTDWIGQVTRVLNNHLGTGWYETKEMPNDPPTQAQRDLLWRDVILDIDNNYPIVANIVAPANNHPPGYPNYTIYHYFTVIGYDTSDSTVLIADPAGFGPATYWLTFNQLATLIPPKGYSA
ncbi:peptidase C39-like protein [Kribbella voronezhensis]|uniref:Peptidase C39-like protein n=1 Tax=Kribbella voronezhensis TaxID=2512212 RepID=A0A4R7STG4_9ACTN|nr:C39 family peptidase [Kribbella voronezhensis]TDU82560.1 peptidase C39-like protein [Kribbella voronezhensis]